MLHWSKDPVQSLFTFFLLLLRILYVLIYFPTVIFFMSFKTRITDRNDGTNLFSIEFFIVLLSLQGRGNRSQMLYKTGGTALKNFADFTGKQLCPEQFKIERLRHRCLPVTFAKYLRTPIFRNICRRLLLLIFVITK